MNLKFIIRIRQSLLLGFCLVTLGACGNGLESGTLQSVSVPAASDSLSVTTFNTGLATGFVPYSTERKAKIIDALDSSDSDVICLQEVWNDTDRDEIITALNASYPNAYYDQTSQVAAGNPVSSCVDLGPAGVDAGLGVNVDAEFATMLGCLQTKCVPNNISISACISDANYCQNEFIPLYMTNQECVETLQANVGLSGNLNTFIGASHADDVDYAYSGRNGLLLLSKYPLDNTDSIDFIAGTNK
ncbi:MAG: hypothetical protein L3J63_11910, partial [Geopsychrobacter sp.]|nr:hypothetical protein [Geopsychrobacter sp.]